MLQNKNALILGAGGAIGSAVARRLTAEGALVFLAGRTESVLESLAAELDAPWQRVDGTDEAAVSSWVDRIAREAGGIDVVFNAIGPRTNDAHYATPSMTISYERFTLPLNLIVGSQFLTARAAARHMVPRGRGAIVFLSACGGPCASRKPRPRSRGWRLTWRAASRDRSSTCAPARSCHDSGSEVKPC